MIPVVCVPPETTFGETVRLDKIAGLIVNNAVLVWPPAVAVIVDVVVAPTPVVLIVKLAVVEPARTVTVAGTVAPVVAER